MVLSLPLTPPPKNTPGPPTAPCPQVGLRGYYACRQLLLAGYDAVNVKGGWKSERCFEAAHELKSAKL